MEGIPKRSDIERILSEVKDPETGVSVKELGLIKAIDYFPEEKRLLIRVDFKRRTPSCPACASIAWLVQRKILDELYKEFIKFEGIEKVEFKE